jgi:uncharacterized membrane protein YoaK (UPF0700 family)
MKIKQLSSFPIGVLLLAIVILMERYLPVNNLMDFIEGLLLGLSMVLLFNYFFKHSRMTVCN